MLCFHEHVKRYRVILRDFHIPGFPFETMPIHHIFPKVLVQGVPKKLTAKADREVGSILPWMLWPHVDLIVAIVSGPRNVGCGMWDFHVVDDQPKIKPFNNH